MGIGLGITVYSIFAFLAFFIFGQTLAVKATDNRALWLFVDYMWLSTTVIAIWNLTTDLRRRDFIGDDLGTYTTLVQSSSGYITSMVDLHQVRLEDDLEKMVRQAADWKVNPRLALEASRKSLAQMNTEDLRGLRRHLSSYKEYLRIYIAIIEGRQPSEFSEFWNLFGPMILSGALALRMGKATADFRRGLPKK